MLKKTLIWGLGSVVGVMGLVFGLVMLLSILMSLGTNPFDWGDEDWNCNAE